MKKKNENLCGMIKLPFLNSDAAALCGMTKLCYLSCVLAACETTPLRWGEARENQSQLD